MEVSPLENASGDEILTGTVADATADTSGGMERLTKQVQREINQCNAAGHDFTLPDPSYLELTPPADFSDELFESIEAAEGESEAADEQVE